MTDTHVQRMQLLGWLLFVASAIAFLQSSQDRATWCASLFFLFGCIVFIIPLVSVMWLRRRERRV